MAVEYLRPKEAADRLRISRMTLYRWIKQGRIRASKLSARCTVVSSAELARFYNANVGKEGGRGDQ